MRIIDKKKFLKKTRDMRFEYTHFFDKGFSVQNINRFVPETVYVLVVLYKYREILGLKKCIYTS